MKENKIEVVKQGVVITESEKTNTIGFIKKVEDQVDMLDFIHWEMRYEFDIENPTFGCPFCGSTIASFKIDKKRKQFRCSVCGLNGGLVLFLMLYHKISLETALHRIANLVPLDATAIPQHVLITQRKWQ